MKVGYRSLPGLPGLCLILSRLPFLQRCTQHRAPQYLFPKICQAPSPKVSLLTPSTPCFYLNTHQAGTKGPTHLGMWTPFPHLAVRLYMELHLPQAAMPLPPALQPQDCKLPSSHPTHSNDRRVQNVFGCAREAGADPSGKCLVSGLRQEIPV